ncbi:zinc finger homeobox protein 4 isoform X2 [Syngnathus scovelli]|uniref:zinc finger homeobox protein 4 isoform X2 n=1 Tax=Syngnathus scovelli TaxID=161590 RepID=UPI0021107B7F|nr:zinc finger homeobox protein 4 isoform X2 [Syngnathus scovelli]
MSAISLGGSCGVFTREESGEKATNYSNGKAARLCPLCQKGQEDQASLSRHLTEQHNVLPTCVDKLLDISVLKQRAREEENESVLSSAAVCTQARPSDDISSEICRRPCLDVPQQHRDKEMEEDRMLDREGSEAETEPEEPEDDANEMTGAAKQTAAENEDTADNSRNGAGKNGVPAENGTQFKCNACQERFPSKTALSVHYYSASHIQRMTTIQGGESDPPAPSSPALSRPYVSNKPYQCATCRVSYNHAITLESHMKSVLHQTRSRNAVNNAGAPGSGGSSSAGTPKTTVSTPASGACKAVTNANCATTATVMVTRARDAENIVTSPSLIATPVASAQAVSAFLTLLTSSPSTLPHPLLPSLFAPSQPTGADTSQIVPQPHMVLPLILNGLQAQQTQQSPENQQGQLLTQCVPFVGLNAAQQALLTQRLSLLQNQWAPVAPPSHTPAVGERVKEEMIEKPLDQVKAKDSIKTEKPEEEGSDVESKAPDEVNEDVRKTPRDSGTSARHVDVENEDSASLGFSPVAIEKSLHNNILSPSPSMVSNPSYSPPPLKLTLSPDSTPQKSQRATSPCGSVATAKSSPLSNALSNQYRLHCNTAGSVYPELPALSEFQSEVLWAFFESRSEADAASPLREDCEALGREVGLSEEEVRKWLCQARYAKQRKRASELAHQQGSSSFVTSTQSSDNDFDDEESSLIIAEEEEEDDDDADVSGSQAIDLSCARKQHRPKGVGREGQGDSCLTSDSENEVYTSVIVTDEESQNAAFREAPDSPAAKDEVRHEVHCEKGSFGGKVLRSTTVFLSDAEDDDEDEDGGGTNKSGKKKRKGEFEHEVEVKKERLDPDVDLELEAQGDPPGSLPYSLDQHNPSGALHSLPLSLAPFSTQFLSPYVLSLTPSLVGSKVPVFSNSPAVAQFSSSLLSQSPSPMSQSSQYLANGDCETALDLSMGKNNSSSSQVDNISAQKGQLLDGLGLRPTSQGLVVVQVKPESLATLPSSYSRVNLVTSNNLTKASVYTRPDEKRNAAAAAVCENDKEKEQETQQRKAKGKRYRDMRRSRTIIQAEQLDILYGCYFKDPNPGKQEFEQISEWVHLPKKVVQIWFQNMRARERKGEVRFISDGTLAAVGKPLIKFTWPLSKPIFSNKPVEDNRRFITTAPIVRTLIKTERKPVVVKKHAPIPIKPKEVVSATPVVGGAASVMSKAKLEGTSGVTALKVASSAVPTLLAPPEDPLPVASRLKEEEESEEEKTDEEADDENGTGPRLTNRMVPKLPTMPMDNRPPSASPHKPNGLSYWNPKASIRINTLSREQLALPAHPPPRTIPPPPTPSIAPVSPNNPNSAKVARSATPVLGKSSPADNNFLAHSSSRRPRTHLSCLQLSILQSCYETCAHPNAMECEAIGAELNLPLKVVQIWFQNTRAKEKRWRLQQEKLGPQAGGKVSMSSGSYLQYNALKANRPILPKPVQLTITETPTSLASGQSAPNETLTGCCEVCKVSFESRAAARAHVFSSLHLAKLRTTNFGQPTALVNKNGTAAGGSGGVNLNLQVGHSSSVTGSASGGVVVIKVPPATATSSS